MTPRGTEFGYISEKLLNPLLPIEVGIPISDESAAVSDAFTADAFTIDPDLLGAEDI